MPHARPASFYLWGQPLFDRILARSWQLLEPTEAELQPDLLLPGSLNEPIIQGGGRVLSNVCTHRGARLLREPCARKNLRCAYHGRSFSPEGKLLGRPGFEDAPPSAEDLPSLPLHSFGPLQFTAIQPALPFPSQLQERLSFLPLENFHLDPAATRDYTVNAHFLLYLENYLEGLHIPFVHPALNQALDWKSYRMELFPGGSLQIGLANADGPAFELPPGHPDHGQRIAAYWYALHPCTLLNFYPWGLSVNRLLPEGPERTRIRYHSYVWKEELRGKGAGGALDQVELEDDAIVEEVQRGLRSRLYRGGLLSPRWEQGVAHLHRELDALLADPTDTL